MSTDVFGTKVLYQPLFPGRRRNGQATSTSSAVYGCNITAIAISRSNSEY